MLQSGLRFFKSTYNDLVEKYCHIIDQIPSDYFKSIDGFDSAIFRRIKLMRHKFKAKAKLLEKSITKLQEVKDIPENSPPINISLGENTSPHLNNSLQKEVIAIDDYTNIGTKECNKNNTFSENNSQFCEDQEDPKTKTLVVKQFTKAKSIYESELSSEEDVEDLIENIKEYNAHLNGRGTKYDNFVYKDLEEVGQKNSTLPKATSYSEQKASVARIPTPVLDSDGFPVRN